MFDEIFSIFNKVNTGVSQVGQMQNTVDSVLNEKNRIANAKSKGIIYTIIVVVIIALVVVYIIYG
jgi:hypothetical protein